MGLLPHRTSDWPLGDLISYADNNNVDTVAAATTVLFLILSGPSFTVVVANLQVVVENLLG